MQSPLGFDPLGGLRATFLLELRVGDKLCRGHQKLGTENALLVVQFANLRCRSSDSFPVVGQDMSDHASLGCALISALRLRFERVPRKVLVERGLDIAEAWVSGVLRIHEKQSALSQRPYWPNLRRFRVQRIAGRWHGKNPRYPLKQGTSKGIRSASQKCQRRYVCARVGVALRHHSFLNQPIVSDRAHVDGHPVMRTHSANSIRFENTGECHTKTTLAGFSGYTGEG